MLAVRSQSETAAKWTHLAGETSRGHEVRLTLVDGRLTRIDLRPSGHCRTRAKRGSAWMSWRWRRVDGLGIAFDHEGDGFRVRERRREPDVRWVADARGELRDGGESARGTVYTRWVNDWATCEGRVSFSATKTP